MSQYNPASDWPAIKQKLESENKPTLIQTIGELASISPQAHHFLQARYLQEKINVRTNPYQQEIDSQFKDDMPDLSQIQQIIQNYQLATKNEEKGTASLWIYALESSASFLHGAGMHNLDYQSDLIELNWEYVYFMENCPQLYPLHKERIFTICQWLNESSDEMLSEPFYQLEADIDALMEDI